MNKFRLLFSKIYRFFYPISLVDMYRRMGVKIGANCKIQFDVIIDYSHYWLIDIGDNVTIAPRVHILSHDASTKLDLGVTRIGKVTIGDNVFIGAGSIILPGVSIGNNAIIGSGSVVVKNVPTGKLYAGNPAKEIGDVKDYLEKRKLEMENSPYFDESYTLRKGVSDEKKKYLYDQLGDRFGYID